MISQRLPAPLCPICGQFATAEKTKYGIRHECCGLHSWGGKPLVDQATHDARRLAHVAFDPLWKEGVMPRKKAYKALAAELGIPRKECHIALMDAATARRVPAAVATIREGD